MAQRLPSLAHIDQKCARLDVGFEGQAGSDIPFPTPPVFDPKATTTRSSLTGLAELALVRRSGCNHYGQLRWPNRV